MISSFDHGKAIAEIHQGNDGARDVCFQILDSYSLPDSERIFESMINKKLTGAVLERFYKEQANEDLDDLVYLVVNQEMHKQKSEKESFSIGVKTVTIKVQNIKEPHLKGTYNLELCADGTYEVTVASTGALFGYYSPSNYSNNFANYLNHNYGRECIKIIED